MGEVDEDICFRLGEVAGGLGTMPAALPGEL